MRWMAFRAELRWLGSLRRHDTGIGSDQNGRASVVGRCTRTSRFPMVAVAGRCQVELRRILGRQAGPARAGRISRCFRVDAPYALPYGHCILTERRPWFLKVVVRVPCRRASKHENVAQTVILRQLSACPFGAASVASCDVVFKGAQFKMPLTKFARNADDGFYLLATSGRMAGCYPGEVHVVSERMLKDLDDDFKGKGMRYKRVDPRALNNRCRLDQKSAGIRRK